jgi:hypothetical protein
MVYLSLYINILINMYTILIDAGKIILPFLIPSTLNIITHITCEYFQCNEWYSLLGLNMGCNACIDGKKILKDHQMNMYWSISSVIISKMDLFIKQ